MKQIKKLILLFLSLLLFSYFTNFVWESIHTVFLYSNHNFEALIFVKIINYVSILDSIIVLGMYLINALIWKNIWWLKSLTKKNLSTFVILGLGVATLIEYRAVFLLGKWSYSKLMPLIFGIGLSPLIQLSLTGTLVLFLTKKILQ